MALLDQVAPAPLAAAGLFVVAAAVLMQWRRYKATMATIPSPDGDSAFLWGRAGLPPDTIRTMRRWAEQYGELFRLRIGWYDWVVVNSPAAFKEIFDRQSIKTASKIPAPIGHGVVTDDLRIFTMSYGPKWRTHRSIMHRLLAPKATAEFVPSQEFEVKQFLWQLAHDNDGRSWYQHVRRLSFSIISTSAYGRRIDSYDHPDVHDAAANTAMLGQITRPGVFIEDDIPIFAKLPTWLQPSRRKAKGYAEITIKGKMRSWNQLKGEIEQGVAVPSFGRDLFESDFTDGVVDDGDAAWITGGLADAGTEITAVVMQNMILHLAATPAAQDAAFAELERVVGGERTPVFADMQSLPYVRACFKEAMRICPVPTWAIKHFTDDEVQYKEHRIPKGTVVLANTSFLHYDPARYAEPHLFRPERYLAHTKSSAEYAAGGDPYARDQFTFGGGRRVCPGARLAENTVDIMAANLLWAFRILPPLEADGTTLGTIDTGDSAFEPGAFRAPKPFAVRFVPRDPQRLELLTAQWEKAQTEGYVMRGVRVSRKEVETETGTR